MRKTRLVWAASFTAALGAGCATTDPAPVEFRVGEQGEDDGRGATRPDGPRAGGAFTKPSTDADPAPLLAQSEPVDAPDSSEAPIESLAQEDSAPAWIAPPNPSNQDRAGAPGWAARPGPSLADYALQPGEVRPFDPKSPPLTHEVAPGDTVVSLSALYLAPVRAIIDENALAPPFALEPGMRLKVPRPRLHEVRPGETLLALARTYSVDARSLALLNGLRAPYVVRPGDSILLPPGARAQPSAIGPTQTTASDEASIPAASPAASPATGPARSERAGAFSWPLKGPVIARFGPGANGRRMDGIDIAAPAGAPIAAAASGRVVYAGTDLPGYGALVLVQHPSGWVTAYARAGRLNVSEGDAVQRGQVLGLVGKIGAEPTRLHFQVRRGRAARDPLSVLPQS